MQKIVPFLRSTVLGRLLGDRDPQRAGRVMKAMLQMDKIDIQRLKQAYEGP